MNKEELSRLIGKYYDGDSTVEEEKILRAYFSSDKVPEGYETEKMIFGSFMASGDIPEPLSGFDERIIAGIDASYDRERSGRVRKYLVPLLSAAAGFLLLAGSYFLFIHRSAPADTFTDPKIAYAETIKILMEVSFQLNHGARPLKQVSKINEIRTKSFEALNKSAILVDKNLKSLDYLEKMTDLKNVPLKNR